MQLGKRTVAQLNHEAELDTWLKIQKLVYRIYTMPVVRYYHINQWLKALFPLQEIAVMGEKKDQNSAFRCPSRLIYGQLEMAIQDRNAGIDYRIVLDTTKPYQECCSLYSRGGGGSIQGVNVFDMAWEFQPWQAPRVSTVKTSTFEELKEGQEFLLPDGAEAVINTDSGSYKRQFFFGLDTMNAKVEKKTSRSVYVSLADHTAFSPKFKRIRISKEEFAK